ncbi:uncharacterized protein [Branchiostoma lanceolatum]|uniref:uncharacterized protein n=1 Tax=Branchiostoma lanceolatum TaxID=7740 RepID=UPI0034571E34
MGVTLVIAVLAVLIMPLQQASGHTIDQGAEEPVEQASGETASESCRPSTEERFVCFRETGASQGCKGERGFPGSKGDQGPVGPRGERGLPGSKGDQGPVGPRGERGLPGSKGDQGPVGPRGERGLPGSKGGQGPVGPKGDRGSNGSKGDLGPVGSKGDPGSKGDLGLVGPRGERGVPGSKGQKGDRGITGPYIRRCDFGRVDTGATHSLNTGFGVRNVCKIHRFSHAFHIAPRVHIGLAHLDHHAGQERIHTYVKAGSITTTQVEVCMETWHDTKWVRVQVEIIACA